MTPEGKVKAKVKAVLKPFIDSGVCWVDWPVPGGFGKSGLDCHGCAQGAFFAIETKRDGKDETDRQKYTREQMERAGADVFVIGRSAEALNSELDGLRRYLEFQSVQPVKRKP